MTREIVPFLFALVVATGALFAHADTYTATNVVVAPLTGAHWTQGAPYNDYSPLNDKGANWAAGCVAIAAAQELLVWQWPWRFGAVHEASHIVAGSDNATIRFDGTVPFEWDALKDSYSSSDSLASRHAAARLTLFCQSLVQMQFVSSGGEAKKGIDGTMEWYEYDGNVTPSSGDAAIAKILSDLEFGSPLQVGVNVGGYGGHEVVGVGYGTGTNATGETVQLLGLNMGWGGSVQWWNLASTSGSYIKSAKVGFRPIKSVQIEPLAPVSGSSVTLNWHLPNCYTNKISGFTVAKKTLSASTTTWTDDFSTGGKGRSSNANAMRVKDGALFAWDGTASSIYTFDEKFELTSGSVLTYDVGSAYMSGMQARFEAKFGEGEWQKIGDIHLNGGRTSYYDKDGAPSTMTSGVAINLGVHGGEIAQFRIAVEYTSGGTYANNWASMKIDNLSVSNVRMFDAGSVTTINDASARGTTQSGLNADTTYAFSVAPIMSDGSISVTQTVTTVVGTPAAAPGVIGITAVINGIEMLQEGFYLECGSGTTTFTVTSANATALQALPSHLSILPDSAVSVSGNSGVFTVTIDGSKLSSRWEGAKTILTLKATNGDGAVATKDIVLKFNRNIIMGARTYTLTGDANATAAVEFTGGTTIDGDGHTLTVKAGAFTGTGDVTLTNGTFIFEDLGDFAGTINVDTSAAVSFVGTSCQVLKGSGVITISANATINDYSAWDGTVVVLSGTTVTVPSSGLGWTEVESGGTLKIVLSDEEEAYGYSTDRIANSGTMLLVNERGETLATNADSFAGNANFWTEATGTSTYAAAQRWSKGRIPEDDEHVIFKNTGGTTIYLDAPAEKTLRIAKVEGGANIEKMMFSDHPLAQYGYTYYTIHAEVFRNESPVNISSTLFQPYKLEPKANIYLAANGMLDGLIDYVDAITYMQQADLKTSSKWRGTVVVTGNDRHVKIDDVGNTSSHVKMNGATGSLWYGDYSHVPIELEDNGETIAFNWNNGYSNKTNFVGKILGGGTLKISAVGSEKVVLRDASEFMGSLDLSAKTLILGDSVPAATSSDGRLHLCSGYGATVASGKTWKIGGGVYLDGNQTLDVQGVLDTTQIFANAANPLLRLSDGGLIEVDTIPSASQRINANLYAGTFRINADATISDGFCFSSTNDTYTTLDVNGHELTFGSNAISGHGVVYPTSSAENSKGRVAFQDMGYFAGDIIIDGTTVVEFPEDMSGFEGRIQLTGSEMATSAGCEGNVVLSDGAVLTLSLSDAQVSSGYSTGKVTLDGSSTLVFADESGNVLSVLSSADAVNGTFSIEAQDPVYTGPAPTAVWVRGEFLENHNGYSVVTNLGNAINAAGNILIGSDAAIGATIDMTVTNCIKASILVKYELPSVNAPVANSVIVGMLDTYDAPFGAICTTTVGAASLTGYWQSGNNLDTNSKYSFSPTTPTVDSVAGFMLFSYYSANDGGAYGARMYVGNSVANLTGGQASSLQFRNRTISKIGIGGPVGGTAKPWAGLKIESVALFVDQWLQPSDIEGYSFPEPEEPTTGAKLVNGNTVDYFETIEGAINPGLIMALNYAPANPDAYVQVLDQNAETPNIYADYGIAYDSANRRYCKAVAKIGSAGYVSLTDAWNAAGKGADTATVTILSAPSDSVTVGAGQTLKVIAGSADLSDNVSFAAGLLTYTTTSGDVTTYTARNKGTTLPGIDTNVPMTVGNFALDSTGEWAEIVNAPIRMTLDPSVNRFKLSFDVEIPTGVYGTLFSWDSTNSTEAVDSRVVVTNDASKMVIWRKSDGTLTAVVDSESALIASGQHTITVTWVHNAGCTIYVDGEKCYSSENLKFSDHDTTKFAIGGSALGSPDDVLAGLKVKNFTYNVYSDAVTRLDGTVYHGNDANRAVITNYLSQMVGHRPVKMPAPNTVDLLIVYDKPSAEFISDAGQTLEEHAAIRIARMNRILTTTDIDTNVWFRLVGVYALDVAAPSVYAAMDLVRIGTAEGWTEVSDVRDRVGADVVLAVAHQHDADGYARWCNPEGIRNGSAAAWAFAGVHHGYDEGIGWAWVHEVGHLASLYHNMSAAADENNPNYIGCGFGKTTEADDVWVSSIMNYGTGQLAFSSKNHMSHGEIYSVTNGVGEYLDSTGVLAELLPCMANYRDTKVNAWSVTPQSGSTVKAGDTMTVTCEDPEATIWYSRYGEETEMQYDGPVEIDTSSSWCIYNVMFKKNGETLATTMVSYMTQEGAVAKIGETYYASLAAAVAVATASQAESVEISLLKSSSENVTLDAKTTIIEASSGLYTGTLSGSGTLVLAGTRSAAMSFGTWTGTVVLPTDLTTLAGFRFDYYGISGSTIRLASQMRGWIQRKSNQAPLVVDATVEIPATASLEISDFSPSFKYVFASLKGSGTFAVTATANSGNQLGNAATWTQDFSAYILVNDVSEFTGTMTVTGDAGIAVGSVRPDKNTVGGKILLTSADARLAATASSKPKTTVANSYVKLEEGVYSVEPYSANVVPGTLSQEEMTQRNVVLDSSSEWAVIQDDPIFFTVPLQTNVFTVAVDVDVTNETQIGTLFGFMVDKTNSITPGIRVRRRSDGSLVGDDGEDSEDLDSSDPKLVSGVHKIRVEYAHNGGTSIYLDGTNVFANSGLAHKNWPVTRFAIGGSAKESNPADIFTGLKVRNLVFLDGVMSQTSYVAEGEESTTQTLSPKQAYIYETQIRGKESAIKIKLNNVKTTTADSAKLIDYFDLDAVETNVVFKVESIDLSDIANGNIAITPEISPALVNGALWLLGSENLSEWHEVGEVSEDFKFDTQNYNFFKFEIRD